MGSRMTPEQLAETRRAAQNANDESALAIAANGHGVRRTTAQAADAELVARYGRRKANQMKEQALVRAGARPKGLARFFG